MIFTVNSSHNFNDNVLLLIFSFKLKIEGLIRAEIKVLERGGA